ncbi:MAG: hypothetical protein QXN15_00165 [Candidatus Jordarchaeales archaeon]
MEETNTLKETVKELDQSAKLIRDLVSNLIKLRHSLLKAYSGLSKLLEEPELMKPAAPSPTPLPAPPSPPTPTPQQAEEAPSTPPATAVLPVQPPVAPPTAPHAVEEVLVEGEMANFVTAFSGSIKSDPHVSNVIKKLNEFKEKIEKKYVYHPVLSEVKLAISKLQGMPGDSVLSESDVNEILRKLSNWVSRLS